VYITYVSLKKYIGITPITGIKNIQEDYEMAKTKSKSIRMTDIEYGIIKNYSKSRKLPIRKCIVELIQDKQPELSPDILCRLKTISTILRDIPKEYWNEEIVRIYEECVEKLCVLLKW
ncbi:MAG: hypothetical protein K2H01_05775, partial [Ruminococcus sp.]|nr:hypothetical protein [Ruminococcus sp.]